jgi:hypothetical protein
MAKVAPDLSGVYLKLDWANTHLQTLRKKLETFEKGNPAPFGFRTEETSRPDKSVEYVLYAIVRETPPADLAPVIGDVLHNVRSALDHLVYELAPPRVRKKRKTQFPIFTDECRFKVISPPYIEGITGDERTLIERVQPYNASPVPQNDPLAVLSELSNLDKHRLLVPVIAAVSNTNVWVGSDNADIRFTFIEQGAMKHDTKIVAFTASPQDASKKMDVHPQSGLEIQLADTGATMTSSAVNLLDMVIHHVRRSVVSVWFEYGFMPPTWQEVLGPSE